MARLRRCRRSGVTGLGRPETYLVKRLGRRECAALSKAGLFPIRNGARGKAGRACEELETVRPGAATRERFLRVRGKSVLVSRRGESACLAPPKIRLKFSLAWPCGLWFHPVFRKNVCDLTNLTTDLRLRLLSSTKLVISRNGHDSRHAHIGRARKRSVEGIPVPVEGRD
jgi:hypothetical protein